MHTGLSRFFRRVLRQTLAVVRQALQLVTIPTGLLEAAVNMLKYAECGPNKAMSIRLFVAGQRHQFTGGFCRVRAYE